MKKPPSASDKCGEDDQEQLRTLVAAELELGDAVDTADEKRPAKKATAKKSA